ncbi:hypothetical protein ACLI4Q_10915 [Natrialbaceae archaeon A-CW1-1]
MTGYDEAVRTNYERTAAIIKGLDRPRSVSHIAEKASVDIEFAQACVNLLEEFGVVQISEGEKIWPNRMWFKFVATRNLLDRTDQEQLFEPLNRHQYIHMEEKQSQELTDDPIELVGNAFYWPKYEGYDRDIESGYAEIPPNRELR